MVYELFQMQVECSELQKDEKFYHQQVFSTAHSLDRILSFNFNKKLIGMQRRF